VPPPSTEGLRTVMHLADPIYEVLFNSEGVVAAHAGAITGDPVDFPFDQVSSSYPNQVRIGFISSTSSGLDAEGRGTVNKVDQFPNAGQADVFINWGCDGDGACGPRHYEAVLGLGMAEGTPPIMSSSYISPVGLARLANLRYAQHGGETMSNALIQTLKRELTPALCGDAQPCVYQDPIAYAQFEVYRLHYK
jgi:hypothetical protein